jgi:hypothetical protein
MQEPEARPASPALKELVAEASQALARLDAARLEELALSCQALTRMLQTENREECDRMARQAREAEGDMAVFARVLEATRANLNVMNRLRALRAGQLEYTERQARGGNRAGCTTAIGMESKGLRGKAAEDRHGDH